MKANPNIKATIEGHCDERGSAEYNLGLGDRRAIGPLARILREAKTEADIMRALGQIHANGYLYQGSKPVHWCVDCGSALAEAEVEYEDKISPAIDVSFKVVDNAALARAFGIDHLNEPVFTVIWTTTPWTLPANQAVCVHPDIQYSLVRTERGFLIIANEIFVEPAQVKDGSEGSLYRLMRTYGLNAGIEDIVAFANGIQLEGIQLQHPFYDRHIPVICGEHVTLDAGTGLVHTAPAHGLEDYAVGMRYDLPVDNPVDDKGKFFTKIPLVGGMILGLVGCYQSDPNLSRVSLLAQEADDLVVVLKAGALQRAIFNSANFSSIATDAKGVIQIFNVGAERMLGYAAADVMNKITPANIANPMSRPVNISTPRKNPTRRLSQTTPNTNTIKAPTTTSSGSQLLNRLRATITR